MRAGPIIAGALILVLGFGMAGTGGAMKNVGDVCVEARCGEDEALAIGMIGTGLLYGGMLLGLAGIGLLVAGILAPSKTVAVPVQGPATRACPSCEKPMGVDARYCAACGAAVAPIATV